MSNSKGALFNRIKYFIVLILIGIAWGANMPLSKTAVSSGHQPIGLIFWQLLISISVLGTYCKMKRISISLSKEIIIYVITLGILGILIPNSFLYMAAANLPAGIIAIIIATVPMFALLVALLFKLERFNPVRFLGILLGMLAIILLLAPSTSLPDASKSLFVLVAAVAPLSYGIEANYVDVKKPDSVGAIETLLLSSICALVIATPMMLSMDAFVNPLVFFKTPEKAMFAAGFINMFAYVGYLWLVSVSGAVFASQVAYIVTLAGVCFSILFLNELYSAWVWTALLLMLIALTLVRPNYDKLNNKSIK